MKNIDTNVILLIAAMIICTSVLILEQPLDSTIAELIGITVFVLTAIMAGISAASLIFSKRKKLW